MSLLWLSGRKGVRKKCRVEAEAVVERQRRRIERYADRLASGRIESSLR